jgi:hypothetical protein
MGVIDFALAPFADEQGLLRGAESGRRAAQALSEATEGAPQSAMLALDFAGVVDMTASFADPGLIEPLCDIGSKSSVIAGNVPTEIAQALRYVAWASRRAVTIVDDYEASWLVSPNRTRDDVLAAVLRLKVFTPTQLGAEVGLSREAAAYHVKCLYESGALTRTRRPHGRGGGFVYAVCGSGAT